MTSIFAPGLLTGRVAVVTGGSSGIGLRIAERFAEHGAHVVLIGRRPEKLEAARLRIAENGGSASVAAVDVREYNELEAALAQAAARHGSFDIVLAGAAGNFPATIANLSSNGFKAVVDIDLLGTFNTVRASYPHLRKPGAHILAISANHATMPIAAQAHVCAAKAGVELFIKTVALEWGPEGVRANILTPGPTAGTEGMRRLAPTLESTRLITGGIPLRRFGTTDELADLALFLCSDAAAYITGAAFVCDGGAALSAPRFVTLPE